MTDLSSKPLAVITGASSGIGYHLAKEFAAHDYNLLVVGESDKIHSVVQDFEQLGATVQAVQTDLSTETGVTELYDAIKAANAPVEAICLNAGIGSGGPFAETDLQKELKLIDLNIKSVVYTAKLVLQDMLARNKGRILFTSSIASTMPGPFEAVYSASKSFVQSFSEALRNEVKDTGVTVTALMPGPTETNFFHRAGLDNTKVGQDKKDDPAEVARQGFKALMDGDEKVLASSIKTKIMGTMNAFMPDAAKAEMHRKMSEPQTPEKKTGTN